MNEFEVLDWRRQVAEIYQQVRAATDPERAHRLWRERRDELFASHGASPLPAEERRQFNGLSYAPYDPSLRFEAAVDTTVAETALEIATEDDGVLRLRRLGRIGFGLLGGLDLWWIEGYGGGAFLPLADPHPDSYPGGRYVLDTRKGADLGGSTVSGAGEAVLVVDFNFSYNPSCAYDPRWSCPLAPAGNRLNRAVEAGERYLGSAAH